MKYIQIILLMLIIAGGCQPKKHDEAKEVLTPENNSLTEDQINAGWRLLFDGKSTSGWKNYNQEESVTNWSIDNDALILSEPMDKPMGYLISKDEFDNFELMLEWKIDSCGNSGIIFNVVEDNQYNSPWLTGPEMQVLDNECHPDAKIIKHRAGDLYDLISCSTETVRPAGEWNQVRIISNKGSYQFWLNGTNVVNFTMHTPEWDEMVAASKFKEMPDFGKATRGHIALQDHGDKVWYRNIMIREL